MAAGDISVNHEFVVEEVIPLLSSIAEEIGQLLTSPTGFPPQLVSHIWIIDGSLLGPNITHPRLTKLLGDYTGSENDVVNAVTAVNNVGTTLDTEFRSLQKGVFDRVSGIRSYLDDTDDAEEFAVSTASAFVTEVPLSFNGTAVAPPT